MRHIYTFYPIECAIFGFNAPRAHGASLNYSLCILHGIINTATFSVIPVAFHNIELIEFTNVKFAIDNVRLELVEIIFGNKF